MWPFGPRLSPGLHRRMPSVQRMRQLERKRRLTPAEAAELARIDQDHAMRRNTAELAAYLDRIDSRWPRLRALFSRLGLIRKTPVR